MGINTMFRCCSCSDKKKKVSHFRADMLLYRFLSVECKEPCILYFKAGLSERTGPEMALNETPLFKWISTWIMLKDKYLHVQIIIRKQTSKKKKKNQLHVHVWVILYWNVLSYDLHNCATFTTLVTLHKRNEVMFCCRTKYMYYVKVM